MKSDKNLTKNKNVFVRRHGRKLNSQRKEALDNLMPVLGIKPELITNKGDLSPTTLFDNDSEKIYMEIGFGNGEHVKALMEKYPENNFIAIEPFVNGMSAFLKSIYETNLRNVRVWMEDALDVVKSLKSNSIDGMYILNPDPWPKSKHHKRRIVRKETLNEYSRILKDDAEFIMSTDVDELAEWMAISTQNHPDFEWTATSSDDWKNMPEDWIQTRYEKKGIEAGRKQTYLIFKRKKR